jgi:hypothetical protein
VRNHQTYECPKIDEKDLFAQVMGHCIHSHCLACSRLSTEEHYQAITCAKIASSIAAGGGIDITITIPVFAIVTAIVHIVIL